MDEHCKLPTGVDCPNMTRIAVIENDIKSLKDGQDREESFRKMYYAEKEERIKRDAELTVKVDNMDAKLDKLVKRQDEMDNEPNDLIKNLKQNTIWYVLVAILSSIITRIIG